MGLRQLHARGEGLLGTRHQVAVKMGRIRVGDDDVGIHDGPVGEHDATGDALLDADTFDGGAQAQSDSLPFHQVSERLGDGAGAAHGEVHPMRALQEVDQPIDAGGVERITAHEQGLDGECPAKLVADQVTRDHLPDSLVVA